MSDHRFARPLVIIVALLVGIPGARAVSNALRSPESVAFEVRWAEAAPRPIERVLTSGAVRLAIIEARHVRPDPQNTGAVGDSGWVLDIVAEADGVHNDERLDITSEDLLPFQPPGLPQRSSLRPPPDGDRAPSPAPRPRTRIVHRLVPLVGDDTVDIVIIARRDDIDSGRTDIRELASFPIAVSSLGIAGLERGDTLLPKPPGA